jgi:hypothetical protein
MEEGNRRVLRPHRKYLPTPDWFKFKRKMAALNGFLTNLIRRRWEGRGAGKRPERGDILDRILAAIEVSESEQGGVPGAHGSAHTQHDECGMPINVMALPHAGSPRHLDSSAHNTAANMVTIYLRKIFTAAAAAAVAAVAGTCNNSPLAPSGVRRWRRSCVMRLRHSCSPAMRQVQRC